MTGVFAFDLDGKQLWQTSVGKGLNRGQINPMLEFWSDGTGTGICWAVLQLAPGRETRLAARKAER